MIHLHLPAPSLSDSYQATSGASAVTDARVHACARVTFDARTASARKPGPLKARLSTYRLRAVDNAALLLTTDIYRQLLTTPSTNGSLYWRILLQTETSISYSYMFTDTPAAGPHDRARCKLTPQ